MFSLCIRVVVMIFFFITRTGNRSMNENFALTITLTCKQYKVVGIRLVR